MMSGRPNNEVLRSGLATALLTPGNRNKCQVATDNQESDEHWGDGKQHDVKQAVS